MKTKRMLRSLLALVMVLGLFLGCGIPEAQARENQDEDMPVYALIFENKDQAFLSTAFLMQEEGYTYLMTTDSSTYLLDEGCTARLVGPNINETAVCLGSQGYFAYYYAPGLTGSPACIKADSNPSKLYMMMPKLSGSYFDGYKYEELNTKKWKRFDDRLLISDKKMPESLAFGALVYDENGVVGCATQANKGHLAIASFVGMDFPEEASLEYYEGGGLGTGYVAGSRAGEQFWLNHRYTVPLLLDRSLNNCRGFTLEYEVTDVSMGKLSGSADVYVRTPVQGWKKVKTFNASIGRTTVEVEISSPLTFDAVAVICKGSGNGSLRYSDWMAIRDPR